MMDQSAYREAFEHFKSALSQIPEPQDEHYEATRAITGMADCYYFLKKFDLAARALDDLLQLPQGAANPYIRLRRGQVFFHLGDAAAAATEWTCAYLNGGREVFANETDCAAEIEAVVASLEA